MPLDAIRRVTEAEQAAQQAKAVAEKQIKALLAEAEQKGRQSVLQAKAQAGEQADAWLKEAQAQGQARTAELIDQSGTACAELSKKAMGRMDQAVSLILERVV